MILTVYDPTNNKYVDIFVCSDAFGMKLFGVDWVEEPVNYSPTGLYEYLQSLPMGKLRAIHDTIIFMAEGDLTVDQQETIDYDITAHVTLMEWFLDEVANNENKLGDSYIDNIRGFQ